MKDKLLHRLVACCETHALLTAEVNCLMTGLQRLPRLDRPAALVRGVGTATGLSAAGHWVLFRHRLGLFDKYTRLGGSYARRGYPPHSRFVLPNPSRISSHFRRPLTRVERSAGGLIRFATSLKQNGPIGRRPEKLELARRSTSGVV